MPRKQRFQVIMSQHAWERLPERAGKQKITPGRIRQVLKEYLTTGPFVDRGGAIHVPVGKGLYAICVPLPGVQGGGWEVVTFKQGKLRNTGRR